MREYYLRPENKIKLAKYKAEHYRANKEKKKAYDKLRRKAKKELLAKQMKEYANKNRGTIKEYKKNYVKIRRATDPIYRLKCNLQTLIRGSVKRNGFKKNSRTEQILGCSIPEFKQYLEKQFESWMTWENHGKCNGKPKFGWDIDHIIPTSKANTLEELIELNHYTNLRPLCSYVNRNVKRGN